MSAHLKSTLRTTFLLMGLLFVFKNLAPLIPLGQDIASMVILSFQIYVPLWLIQREGSSYKSYGLYDYHFFQSHQKPDWQYFFADLKRTAWFTLATFIPYACLYHLFQINIASHYGQTWHFTFTLPDHFFSLFLLNLLTVALPEEIFYRGFLQTRLLRIWPNQTFLVSLPIGKAILTTSFLFACAHFIGENNVFRLLPFFPALVFSSLAYYSKSLMGAVIYHALCNVFSAILQSSYSWG